MTTEPGPPPRREARPQVDAALAALLDPTLLPTPLHLRPAAGLVAEPPAPRAEEPPAPPAEEPPPPPTEEPPPPPTEEPPAPLAEEPAEEPTRALPQGTWLHKPVTPLLDLRHPPEELAARRFTLFLVPAEARGPLRQVELSLGQVRLALTGAAAVSLLALVGLASGLLAWPVASSRDALLSENIALRARMQDVERKMLELDGQLRRLRLYNTQLEGLPLSAVPGFGPLEKDDASGLVWLGRLDADALAPGALTDWEMGMPMEEPPGEEVASADLSEAEVRAIELSQRTERLLAGLRLVEPEARELVETAAEWQRRQESIPSLLPVASGVLTSGFGWRRAPFTRRWKFHAGIDVAAPPGTPIMAAGSGVVKTVDWHGGYGRMLEIDHGGGIMSRYAHNRTVFVREGEHVTRGQLVATVGMTGLTTGPHLHLEIHVDGVAADPFGFIERP